MATHLNGVFSQKMVSSLSKAVHFFGAPYFVYIFIWHFTSRAAKRITGYYAYGWFYEFLTFWSFNIQTLQLCMVTYHDLFPSATSVGFHEFLGDLSCLVVCSASTVTTMYYVIRTLDSKGLDDPRTRVVWVNTTLHVGNSIIAWADILFSYPRSFSSFARGLVVVYTLSYSSWLLYIRLKTGSFPYPFLNQFPALLAWLVIALIGGVLMLSYFTLGSKIKILFEHYITY